jgi:hypothetical protein
MSDRLLFGQQLNTNDRLVSPNGKVTLVMQDDGNLVLYRTDTSAALWSTNTWGKPVTHAILQTDGNFVCYDAAGKAYWASNTGFGPLVVLHSVVLQDDGNLNIYDTTTGAALWTSNTFQSWGRDCLVADQQLKINDSVTSLNGRVTLILQGDGNLVIYRTGDGPLLNVSNTSGKPVTHVIMQGDGNLVCYDDAGTAYWSTNTWGNAGAYARLLEDGTLVVYDATNQVLWSSNPSPLVSLSSQCQADRGSGAGVQALSNNAFTTWPQNIQFNAPLYFIPKMLSELVNAVLRAESAHHHVRAVGSAWSFSDAISATDDSPVIPGAMIDTSQLNDGLQEILWQILAPGVDATNLFHVEGGITISDLVLLLDQQPGRRALPSGGGRGQTLAGFISTSSHGGDSLVPPLTDFICAIHLVGAGGIQHWIEPDTGITDPAKLQLVYPCLTAGNIHYNTALFNAVLVSGGSMGIIYSVILKTQPQFGLVQHQAVSTWEAVLASGTNLSGVLDGSFMASAYKLVNLLNGSPMPPPFGPFAGNMFSLVVINPYPLQANDATLSGTPLQIYAGQHVCWVTNRVRVPIPTAASNPGGGSLDFSQVGTAAKDSMDPNVDYDLRFYNFQNSISGITDISTKARMLVDFLAQFDQRAISAAITNVYTQSLPIGESLDVSYNLTTGVSFGVRLRSLSIEAAFAVPDGLDFVSKVFALVADYASRTPPIYIGGYLSVRLVGEKTVALMGLQRWSPTCCVEYAMIAGSNGVGDFVKDLQKLALSCHGALHWGQCNDVMTSADLENIYGAASVQAFKQARATLSANGLLTTFNNSFTDRLGISV